MKIQGIFDRARALESRIAQALTRAAESAVGASEREPLEIAHGIVDAVEREVGPSARGARIFPFNHLSIFVLAASPEARARLEALFAARPTLRDRIVDRLRAAGCGEADVQVEVAFAARAARSWSQPHFHVAFHRRAPATGRGPAHAKPARVDVTVLHGAAERRSYSFAASRIEFGRGAELRDSRQQLVGANHVVFVEGSAGANETVSRRHAHLAFDPSSGDVRLRDDGSVHGTGIVRDGRTIPVPPGSRGVRLRSGDEIVLGEARVRIRLEEHAVKPS